MFEAGKITVMIFFIIVASLTFSQILAFSGATTGLLNLIKSAHPEPLTLIAGMMAIMLFLGCFMDPLSIMLITLPFFVPLANAAGVDMIWFGVLMLLALEISQTTPPFGILLFVMKGVAPDVTMRQIYASVAPFILIEIMILIFLMLLPDVVTWLPALMNSAAKLIRPRPNERGRTVVYSSAYCVRSFLNFGPFFGARLRSVDHIAS